MGQSEQYCCAPLAGVPRLAKAAPKLMMGFRNVVSVLLNCWVQVPLAHSWAPAAKIMVFSPLHPALTQRLLTLVLPAASTANCCAAPPIFPVMKVRPAEPEL